MNAIRIALSVAALTAAASSVFGQDLPDLSGRVIHAVTENAYYPLNFADPVTGEGIGPMLRAVAAQVRASREAAASAAPAFEAEYVHVASDDREITVQRAMDGGWDVTGRQVERLVVITDMNNEEAVAYLQRRLARLGVEERLKAAGAVDGDAVHIGPVSFEFEAHDDGV